MTYDDKNNIKLFETLELLTNINSKTTLILSFCLHKPTDFQFLKDYADKWQFTFIDEKDMDEEYRSEDIKIVFANRKDMKN